MRAFLLIFIAVAAGDRLNEWATRAGLVLPGFLTAMLAGVVITNLADALRARVDFAPIERNGEMALQVFLAISLMSLQLWAIASSVPALLTNVVAQVAVTTAVALLVLFPLLGRDYDAAVTVGGFLGFGLSSMPVAMATMDQVTSRFGPAPRAFLLITLAGSFFVDLANAFTVKAFLLLPLFR
jgi:ESS family glutamate:Na+ symporter